MKMLPSSALPGRSQRHWTEAHRALDSETVAEHQEGSGMNNRNFYDSSGFFALLPEGLYLFSIAVMIKDAL